MATIEEQLRAAAAGLQAERVSLAELLHAHGPAARGSLLLLLAVPCLLPIPGTGTVLGFGVLALAVAMWQGLPDSALPPRVADLELSRAGAQRVLATLASIYGLAARVARVRLGAMLAERAQRGLAACLGLSGIVLVLPIPFGNILPALAVALIGLGLVFRDGLAVVLGVVTAAITSAVLLTLLFMASTWAGDWAVQAWA